METALSGGTPDITPLSIYSWMIDDLNAPQWRNLVERGLGLCEHCWVAKRIEHGVEERYIEETRGASKYVTHIKSTPVGEISELYVDGWHTEYWIKSEPDYKIMQWIVENTELVADFDAYEKAEQIVGDNGLAVVTGFRSPAMSINVDWAGTEQFCCDLALEAPELFDLYQAQKKLFIEETQIIASGPGKFVKWLENLTISMLGPKRYRELLIPVYEHCVPILENSGKRVMVHYDGALDVIKDDIAQAPFHIIESLTEPPEGDMTYDQCRIAWPDKSFWANINIDCYYLPEEDLKEQVAAKRERAGKRGLAFEISEDLPANWLESVPVVLETLNELH